jgi:hypothetical protein
MWKLMGLACLTLVIAGCGNKAVKEMRGEEVAEWPELMALDETLRGIGMNAGMKQWKASQAEVKPDTMGPAVDAFAASTAPSGFNASKKDAVVTAYKDLIAAAKGDAKSYEAKYEALMASLRELRTPQ